MTSLIVTIPSPDGARAFELMVHFDDQLTLANTAVEIYPNGKRELRDARDVLLTVGRKPRGTA